MLVDNILWVQDERRAERRLPRQSDRHYGVGQQEPYKERSLYNVTSV